MDDQKPVLAYETPVPKPYSDTARLLVAWLGLLASIAVSLALFNAVGSGYRSPLWKLTLAWLGLMMLSSPFYRPRANA
jgi:fatty acid desaturase